MLLSWTAEIERGGTDENDHRATEEQSKKNKRGDARGRGERRQLKSRYLQAVASFLKRSGEDATPARVEGVRQKKKTRQGVKHSYASLGTKRGENYDKKKNQCRKGVFSPLGNLHWG